MNEEQINKAIAAVNNLAEAINNLAFAIACESEDEIDETAQETM